ncbi:MAG: type II secretion system protein [Candidatus Parcubacteria bacterium]|nr:type II secretion system protein [Candidatus Parcubacteria bacterium]
MKKNKGFTLIELLVVIAIIAILSTVVMAGLNSARAKGRDAKRISDVKALQTALELCYDSANGYPIIATATTIGAAGGLLTTTSCGSDTFATFMNPLPTNPSPGGAAYTYVAAAATTYTIGFSLEGQTGALGSGAHTATPAGIQ